MAPDAFEIARHSKRLVEQQRERIAALEAECERLKANLQALKSAGGEVPEVVAWRHWGDASRLLCDLGKQRSLPDHYAAEFTVPLMTIDQHERIVAALKAQAEPLAAAPPAAQDVSGLVGALELSLRRWASWSKEIATTPEFEEQQLEIAKCRRVLDAHYHAQQQAG